METVSFLSNAALRLPEICGMGLSFRVDGFRLIFACIATWMWAASSLFTKEYLAHYGHRGRYWFFLAVTYLATMGVFLSDDLYTAFVFFELMSLASYVCVIHDEKPATMRAGGVYLAVAVVGGLVTLMGLFLLYRLTGTLSFEGLREACAPILAGGSRQELKRLYIAGLCVLFGFGAKAGMFPLHIWLPMAHPVAPAPASALLSGIITKTGVFGMLVLAADVFPQDGAWGLLIAGLGTVTMLLGGVLAMFSVDLKRTLACSSMSQLGMIAVGIGMQDLLGEHNALAVRGTVLHMVNHANLKLVLFMAAGVVVMNLHELDLNKIRGYGRKKPLLKLVFLSGALGIGGIPLFNGYVSKTLLHESIVEYIELLHEGGGALPGFLSPHLAAGLFRAVEWLFLLTGGMTVAYMTKLFICLFAEKNADPALQDKYDTPGRYCSRLTAAVLAVTALVMPLFGLLPRLTLDKLADLGQTFLHGHGPAHGVNYFSLANLKGGCISIAIGAALYLLFIRRVLMVRGPGGSRAYADRWPKRLDLLTLVYEPLMMRVLPGLCGAACRLANLLSDGLLTFFVAKLVPGVIGLFCRALDFCTDALVLLARSTTHRQLEPPQTVPAGYRWSYHAGRALNALSLALDRTVRRNAPARKDYVLVLARRRAVGRRARHMIGASAAFSLLMFGAGFAAIVLYLLFK